MKFDLPLVDNAMTGVELTLNSNDTYTYTLTRLKKSKGQIHKVISATGTGELKALASIIAKQQCPTIISINGRGIIHKKVSRDNEEGLEALVQKVLPNSNSGEFYVQYFTIDDNSGIASLIRRNALDNILKQFLAEKMKLVGCMIGPFAIQSVIPVLAHANDTFDLTIGVHQISIREGHIVQYMSAGNSGQNSENNFTALGISVNEAIAFASAFSYYNNAPLENNIDRINILTEDLKNEVKFKKTGAILLIVFFAVLLFNFIIYTYYFDKVRAKSAQVQASSIMLGRIDSLQRQLNERTEFLSHSGLSQPSKTSYYADQIAMDIPASVTLTSINVQPLMKSDDDKKNLEFENKRILVSGQAQYALDVNNWIKLMKKYAWTQSVSMLNYKQKEGSSTGDFIIEMKVK